MERSNSKFGWYCELENCLLCLKFPILYHQSIPFNAIRPRMYSDSYCYSHWLSSQRDSDLGICCCRWLLFLFSGKILIIHWRQRVDHHCPLAQWLMVIRIKRQVCDQEVKGAMHLHGLLAVFQNHLWTESFNFEGSKKLSSYFPDCKSYY